jgi:hypothetical protein
MCWAQIPTREPGIGVSSKSAIAVERTTSVGIFSPELQGTWWRWSFAESNEVDLYSTPSLNIQTRILLKKIADAADGVIGFDTHGRVSPAIAQGRIPLQDSRTSLSAPMSPCGGGGSGERCGGGGAGRGERRGHVQDLMAASDDCGGWGTMAAIQPVRLPDGAVNRSVANPTTPGVWLELVSSSRPCGLHWTRNRKTQRYRKWRSLRGLFAD